MTPDDFDMGVAVLMSAWPKEAPPAQTLLVYQAVLGHLPADLWKLAVVRVITEATFFPRPAELFTATVRALMERDGHSEAWARMVLMDGAATPALLFPGHDKPQIEPPELAKERGR